MHALSVGICTLRLSFKMSSLMHLHAYGQTPLHEHAAQQVGPIETSYRLVIKSALPSDGIYYCCTTCCSYIVTPLFAKVKLTTTHTLVTKKSQ